MALVHGALAWSGLPKGGAVATLHCDETFGFDDVDQVSLSQLGAVVPDLA
jgi:hypothetical protein